MWLFMGSFSVFVPAVMLLRNKPNWVEHLGEGVKNVFKKVKNNKGKGGA